MSEADEIFEVPMKCFAALERIRLNPRNDMQCVEGIIQSYEPGTYPARGPILHVGFLAHVLCHVPLVPYYLDGNQFPTAPPGFSMALQLLNCRSDRSHGSGEGSRLHEVSKWLWRFG